MSWLDLVNGCFEFGGACFIWFSVRKLYQDKALRGWSPLPNVYFTSWGFWNLFYYPSLDQWLSFVGGVAVVFMNALWFLLYLRYRKN